MLNDYFYPFTLMETIPIVVFDTETTGLDINTCDLISIAWVKLVVTLTKTVEIVEKRQLFVKDENIKNTERAYEINRISDEYRNRVGVDIITIMNEFVSAIDGCDVYAYCTSFDLTFVRKCRPDAFDNVHKIGDIRIYDESVENAVQRILYAYDDNFKYSLTLENHFHDALDDAWAETMLLLYNIYGVDVKQWLTECVKYEPTFTSGKYRGKRINDVFEFDSYYVKWFVFISDTWHEEYLRKWFMKHHVNFTIGHTPSLLKHVDPTRYAKILNGALEVPKDGPHVEPLPYPRPYIERPSPPPEE